MSILIIITGLCFVLSIVVWLIQTCKFKGSGSIAVASFLISVGALVFPYLLGKYNIL